MSLGGEAPNGSERVLLLWRHLPRHPTDNVDHLLELLLKVFRFLPRVALREGA